MLFFFLSNREQLRKRAEEDLNENINVIRRNLPTKKGGISTYLNLTTQEIADQIAKSLVDRALELDRKKLVKKLSKLNNKFKLQSAKSEMLNNFVGKLLLTIDINDQLNPGRRFLLNSYIFLYKYVALD